MIGRKNLRGENGERGAALITVLFISLLLLTASVAMLTAVGANSKNTSDVLSETKAYYAAESGIQATINVLRNAAPSPSPASTPYTYSSFIANPSLSNWLAYSGSPSQVPVGTDTGYSINVSNPDNGAVTYSTASKLSITSATPASGVYMEQFGGSVYIASTSPSHLAATYTKISIIGDVATTSASSPNTLVNTFEVVKFGPGDAPAIPVPSPSPSTPEPVTFRIDYHVYPRNGVASIYGRMTQASPTAPIQVNFYSPQYSLLGSTLRLCELPGTVSPCPPFTLSLPAVSGGPAVRASFYASAGTFNPSPYRLLVTSTGYGPNGAVKKLEAIVRRNVFDGYDPPSTMVMIGPNHTNSPVTDFNFDPGTSNGVSYSGGVCTSGCVPTFGVTDQTNLDKILGTSLNPPPSPTPFPPTPGPVLVDITNLPSWLQSPSALDNVVNQLRITAQHSSQYFNLNGSSVPNAGSLTTGTGITFCEGSCKLNGDGGGLFVVTGNLEFKGSSNFKGLIIVTGQEGFTRKGAGSGTITGNIVIAPYNQLVGGNYVYPNPVLSSTFLAPSYGTTGGGGSFVPSGDINPFIDNSSAVSDFVAGVAEK